jgi:hypothetical protein
MQNEEINEIFWTFYKISCRPSVCLAVNNLQSVSGGDTTRWYVCMQIWKIWFSVHHHNFFVRLFKIFLLRKYYFSDCIQVQDNQKHNDVSFSLDYSICLQQVKSRNWQKWQKAFVKPHALGDKRQRLTDCLTFFKSKETSTVPTIDWRNTTPLYYNMEKSNKKTVMSSIAQADICEYTNCGMVKYLIFALFSSNCATLRF